MLSLVHNTRIYLHVAPTDMRKSFDGLTGLVRSVFEKDPLEGSWFLFLNRRRDRIKILTWDRDGFVLFYKKSGMRNLRKPAFVGRCRHGGIGRHTVHVTPHRSDA